MSREIEVVRLRIFSVGHSNRTLDEFLLALEAFNINYIADVRSYPRSRHHPQFDREALERKLPRMGLNYVWLGRELGGFKRPLASSSVNDGWEFGFFRNYADYALTGEFASAIDELELLALKRSTAFMCAEKNYRSCHRRIISDHLAARGWEIVHIIEAGRSEVHRITPFARVWEGMVTYPARSRNSRLSDYL